MHFKLSIINKISIIVFCSILAVLIPLLYFVMHNSNTIIASIEKENLKRFIHLINWEMTDKIEYAAMDLQRIAHEPTVQELLAQRDRKALFEYLKDDYRYVQESIIRFHFHLPNGESFLRVHNYDLFGDDLTDIRPMLVDMMQMKKPLKGIEMGREGLSQRVMLPIFFEGEYVGSVEYGMDFGNDFLEKIQRRYEGDYFIYNIQSDENYSFLASTGAAPDCTITKEDIQLLLEGESIWSKECSGTKNVGMIPLYDYSGSPIAFLKVEFSRDRVVEGLSLMMKRFIMISIIIAIIITVVVIFSLIHVFVRPLKNLVAQTTKISRNIDSGNLNFRGDIYETAVDFQEIIQAVNNIITTLRDRENLLKAIVEGFPGIVYYLDRNYTVLWANEQAKTMADGDIIGVNIISKVSVSSFFENESDLLLEAVSEKRVSSRSACYYYPNGSEMHKSCWEHVAIPICNENGEVDNILRVATNITDKEEARINLKRLNETLENRVSEEMRKRQLQEDKAHNQSRLASIGELAAGIAHELNQPLNSIAFSIENVYNRFLHNTIDEAYFRKKIKAISGDIHRTRRIISHVRTFARESNDEYIEKFSINQCIISAISMVGVQFATHEIDITKKLEDGIPEIYGNPFQFEQIILNLLSNAKDAIEERTQQESSQDARDPSARNILIKTEYSNGKVVIEVTDTGTGIPEEIINKVFDPFFSTKAPGTGTGLGLSISYGIVNKMGGTIEIVSVEKGTTMKIVLPIGELT